MSRKLGSVSEIAGGMVLLPILFAPIGAILAAWNAWVLFKLWQWYLLIEAGAPKFSVCFAIALASQLVTFRPRREPSTNESRVRQSLDMLIYPLMILATGWFGSLFLGR
jgi:Mn2+/Fe2+ NRAMP family transporter